ncbi:MAG: class II aldolase/adducin family protein [Dehalococcoidia bacterium]
MRPLLSYGLNMTNPPNNSDRSEMRRTLGWHEERTLVLEAAQAMYQHGLVVASSGNVSMRVSDDGRDDMLAITAAGKDYEKLSLEQVVVVDFEGEPLVGDALPSTEMLLHSSIYQARPDVGAVMHTHSVYASALAVAGIALPPIIDEMVVLLGDSVQVSEYTFPGTEDLGAAVVQALGERNAALIRNHGMVGVGKTPADALKACQLTERLAHIYTAAAALGGAHPLPEEAVRTELEIFRMQRQTPK